MVVATLLKSTLDSKVHNVQINYNIEQESAANAAKTVQSKEECPYI